MADLIDRQTAIKAIENLQDCYNGFSDTYDKACIIGALEEVPSAQPEYRLDEWCTDCKEYDNERHCCPRFNRVIRTTLQEVQAEQPGIIRCKDCDYCVADKCWGRTFYYCDAFSYHAEGDLIGVSLQVSPEHFCGWAERRTDG